MTRESYYVIPCECGATVHSHERETVCPQCKRILVVEWGEQLSEKSGIHQ